MIERRQPRGHWSGYAAWGFLAIVATCLVVTCNAQRKSADTASAAMHANLHDTAYVAQAIGCTQPAPDQPAANRETCTIEQLAWGDLDGDGSEDVLAATKWSSGGSGVFTTLGAILASKPQPTVILKDEAIVGDRVQLQSLAIEAGRASVRYLDRRADEAMVQPPTVPASKQFKVTFTPHPMLVVLR